MARTKGSGKINWTNIKIEYITGKATMGELAKKHGISLSSIYQMSSQENWGEQKAQSHERIEEEAIKEVEGTAKDLIVRHAKVARFLQAASITNLREIVNYLKENPDVLKSKDVVALSKMMQALTNMVDKGLSGERELYPKKLQIEGEVEMKYGEVSDELVLAAHEALIKRLTKKPARANPRNN